MNKKRSIKSENKLWLGNIHNRPVEIDALLYKYNPVVKKLVLPEIVEITKHDEDAEAMLKNKDND